jgi:hypothetical protein
MTISIANRNLPFSHLHGTKCLLPVSTLACEVFPAKLVLYDMTASPKICAEIEFLKFGPIREFTVTLDLEKCLVQVSGFIQEGYFCYHIRHEANGFSLNFIKVPENSKGQISARSDNFLPSKIENKSVSVKEVILFQKEPSCESPKAHLERLSLGSHKAQDIECILRRGDLTDILPLWFHLAQVMPQIQDNAEEAQNSLYTEAFKAVSEKDKETIYQKLYQLFRSGFKSLLFPRLFDEEYQGFPHRALSVKGDASPLILLQKSYTLLRRLFFYEEGAILQILPALPKEFHCGRLLNLVTSKQDVLFIEWTKKAVRKVIIEVKDSKEIHLAFPSDVKTFRVRKLKTQEVLGVFTRDTPISLAADTTYLIDHFQK